MIGRLTLEFNYFWSDRYIRIAIQLFGISTLELKWVMMKVVYEITVDHDWNSTIYKVQLFLTSRSELKSHILKVVYEVKIDQDWDSNICEVVGKWGVKFNYLGLVGSDWSDLKVVFIY